MSSRLALAHALNTGTPPDPASGDTSGFWQAARRQGVLPLLVDTLGRVTPLSPQLLEEVKEEAARAALDDLDLAAAVHQLHERGVRTLVFKGAALAHQQYRSPWLRPHLDADLLIHPRDIQRAHAAFRASGAELDMHVTGRYVMSQFHYVRVGAGGTEHAYDIHWRVVNPPAFRSVFDFEKLWSRSVPLPLLGPAARAPSAADALLIACVHKAAHHPMGGPLIWLVDLVRLSDALSTEDAAELVARARAHRVTTIVAHVLGEAAALFPDGPASRLASALEQATSGFEPTARYVMVQSPLQRTLLDLSTLPWRERLRFVRELAFPSVEYMRTVYAARHAGPLPLLYARRLITGLWRWTHVRARSTAPLRAGATLASASVEANHRSR